MLFFLSSGLFLGWSLGANDAANVFGTAVGTRMVKFKTAAVICSVFVVLGAVVGGAAGSKTLGKLGSVNAIAGAFTVALAAGIAVYLMTRWKLPVSTSQAIVGGIVGWNFFANVQTNYASLGRIALSWLTSPVLAAIIAAFLFAIFKLILRIKKIHLFRLDSYTRTGLMLVGAFGSYSLGANNIANVMGVFVPVAPISGFSIGLFTVSSTEILFFIGGLAISAGVMMESKQVMQTVGKTLFKLSPVSALIVVLSQSIVLLLFSSNKMLSVLARIGISLPAVPVSSSQAVVGAILGIALIKGARGFKYKTLGGIILGWIITPLFAALLSYVLLFIVQNVFSQTVFK